MSQAVHSTVGARYRDFSWISCPWAILQLEEEDGRPASSLCKLEDRCCAWLSCWGKTPSLTMWRVPKHSFLVVDPPVTRFPSFPADMAIQLAFTYLLEVQKGFLAFDKKSNQCCLVHGGLGFPISFMWHREVRRANLVLRSKEPVCLFLLSTGSCSWHQICRSYYHELSLACPNRRMSLEAPEAQPSHTSLGFGTGGLHKGLICN